jgi:hypothetical protein
MIASDFNLTPIMVEADFNQMSDCLPRHAEEILSAGQLHISLQWMRMNPLASLSLCQEGLNDGNPPQTVGKPRRLQKVRPLPVAPPQDDLRNEGSHFSARPTLPSRSRNASRDDQVTAAEYVPEQHNPYNRPLPTRVNIRIIGNHQAHKKQIVALSHRPFESLSRLRRGPSDVPSDKQCLLINPSTPGVSFHKFLK